MGLFLRRGDLAAIEIDGQRDIALFREALGLLANPVVDALPLLNDEQRGMLARRGRRGEKAAAARRLGLEGDRLCEGG